jgi:hypothetical protein
MTPFKDHTKQFLETYGRAMLSWQAVEFHLLLLFLSVIRAHNQHIASGVSCRGEPKHTIRNDNRGTQGRAA